MAYGYLAYGCPMGSNLGWTGCDAPVAVRVDLLHESGRTRVSRVYLPAGTVIRKEPLGPGAAGRLRHETEMLRRLSDVGGVARLASGGPPMRDSILLTDVGGSAVSERPAPWDPAEVVELAEQLARALAGIHRRGVIHRDLNPGNIVLAGGDRAALIIDFALATTTAAPGVLPDRAVVGSVPYLAPEQTGRTGHRVDQRADLYALGAILYELATGAPPFGVGDPLRVIHDHLTREPVAPSEVNPAVPAGLSAIILHLLEKEPDDRYQSAEGLLHDCELLRRGAPVPAPGRADLPAHPLAPSRLVGRERETVELRTAFAEAVDGRCPGVVIGGEPGVGKTALAGELRSIAAAHDGWFVAGKFDQFRRDREYDGCWQAFRALARLLLAEPEDSLVEVRERILRALGPNAGLATATVPEFATLLGVPPDVGDPMTAQVRARRTAVEVLGAVASPKRPIVFFVDDLQWSSPVALDVVDLLLGGEDPIEGLLVVGAYRSSEVDAVHPLRAALARWARQPAAPLALQLRNLAPEDQTALVANLLDLAPAKAAGLARLLAPSTGGNPYETVELVNALRQDGGLTPGERGWQWDPAGLERRLARVDMGELLSARLLDLPPATGETLATMACLAGRARLDLLSAATGLTEARVRQRLEPAFAAGLLELESDDGHPVARFHHDRTQEAVLSTLTAEAERDRRLALARRLGERDRFAAIAAELYLQVADAVRDPAERRRMTELFRLAAVGAKRVIDSSFGERCLAAALRFIDPADTETLLTTRIERHAALYLLGRLAEADEEFLAIRRMNVDAGRTATAIAVQVSSLYNRGHTEEAIALGLEALPRLGLPVPSPDRLGEETDRGLAAVHRWLDTTSDADDLRREAPADRPGLAVIPIVHQLIAAGYVTRPRLLDWLCVTAMRMWATDGPHPVLVGACGWIGVVFVTRERDYRSGYRIMRRILAVSRAHGYEPEIWQAQLQYVGGTSHWHEPLEVAVASARQAQEGLVRGGDLLTAGFTHYVLLYDLLDCAPSLEAIAAEADEAIAFAVRTGNDRAEEVFRKYRQTVRVLRGEIVEPAAPRGATLNLLPDDPVTVCHEYLTQAMLAAVFDRWADLDQACAALAPFLPSYEAPYLALTGRLLRALALAGQVRSAGPGRGAAELAEPPAQAELAELDDQIRWLAGRAADAPANFEHLLRLVEAERAWAVGEFREAACTFDLAQRKSAGRSRPWHRALILERAARFYLAHGMEEAGGGLLAAARAQYLEWGATAKVSQLDYARSAGDRPAPRPRAAPAYAAAAGAPVAGERSADGTLADGTPAGGTRVENTGSAGTMTSGTVDLLGIIAAYRALSSQTGVDGLRAKVVGILGEMTGATGVRLLLRDREEDRWSVPLDDGGEISLAEAARRRLLPASVVRYAARTHEPLTVADAAHDDRFSRDPYFTTAGLDRCSVLAVPIVIRGETRAMLLLENRVIRGAFAADRLEGVMLIAGQLAVSLDNALVYASLEAKVAERTGQLAAANHRLEQLSATDPLTGLANRRHLDEVLGTEWRRAERQGTPIAVAMVDIDHFKAYNDRLGHAAGDRCLRRVAACLAAGVRGGDLAARYGGEEFAIVMPGADGPVATAIAARLRAAVAELGEPHPAAAGTIVTVSIGTAATTPGRGEDAAGAAGLVEWADAALYAAKRAGRDRVEAAADTLSRMT